MSQITTDHLEHQHDASPTEDVSSFQMAEIETVSPRKKALTYILVLGPSGSGKSSLISAVSDEKVDVATPGSGLCTTTFRFAKALIGEQLFRLIDSPGFNTASLSNHEIVKRLVVYLTSLRNSIHAKLTGVLYLHPEESDLSAEQLKQNLGALKNLLGESWLRYVTIVVVPGSAQLEVSADVVRLLQEPSSPFYDFHVAGAKIRGLALQTRAIQEVLLEYHTLPPKLPSFYYKFISGRPRGLAAYIENQLGLQNVNTSSASRSQSHQTRGRGRGGHSRGDRSQNMVSAPEESARNLHMLELALVEVENQKGSIRDQLHQTRSEYASLRSELQLHDNMEQHMIVQSLKDLNRQIDTLARKVAECLVDDYANVHFSITTPLHAVDLSELKAQFGHTEGASSLVMSSIGQAISLEDFLDFALRSILCEQLYANIFLPFHPSLASDPNGQFMNALYKDIRLQEHPNVASKWRASSFRAIAKQSGSELRTKIITQCVEQIATKDLDRMLKSLFGQQTEFTLAEEQNKQFHEIVSSAWDWNEVLKGSVILLGDFQPVAYANGSPFNHLRMEEFERNKTDKSVPSVAICTIGLGLMVTRSKVKGDAPEEEVVSQAIVVTEQRYN